MKKQILTKNDIEKEIVLKVEKFKRMHIKRGLPCFLLLFSTIIFFTIIFVIQSINFYSISLVAAIGIIVILLTINIVGASRDYTHLKHIKKYGGYSLEIDLLEIKDTPSRSRMYDDGIFHFRKYGLTADLNSEVFKTTDIDVYDLAEQGDSFYLAVYKKQILAIYNTKFYELDNELQKELRTR